VKSFEQHDLRFRGWLIQQCPKGRKRFYWFLYWRTGKKLHKEYVPQNELMTVRVYLRNERRRVEREKRSKRKAIENRKMKLKKEEQKWAGLLHQLGMRHSKRMARAFAKMDEKHVREKLHTSKNIR